MTIDDSAEQDFPVDRYPIVDLEEYLSGNRRRGLGTYIVRNFMDDVSHVYHPGRGNRLVLVKKIPRVTTGVGGGDPQGGGCRA